MKYLCHHPWVGLDISPQAKFKPCCKFKTPIADNLDDYFSSNELEKLKKEFLDGQRPEGCERCWKDEDAGILSKRQLDQQYIFDNQIPDYDSIKVLGISFGNVCNLACVTCSSHSSSNWIAYEKKLNIPVIHNHNPFYKNTEFIKKIKKHCKSILDITFVGGESFYAGIDEQLDFLDFLISNDPKNISLTYITNITDFPDERFWTRWCNFKNVNIQLSIDGTDKQAEYIRYPSNWKNSYAVIKQYQQKYTELDNLQLSISHTVSIFNVYRIPEFLEWCKKENLPEPYIGMVSKPPIYDIKNLPLTAKLKISDRLEKYNLSNVIAYMDLSIDGSISDDAKSMISKLDELRNVNIKDVLPEVLEWIK